MILELAGIPQLREDIRSCSARPAFPPDRNIAS